MNIKEIITELRKWQEEDKENRGLVIIANECIAKSEGEEGKCICAAAIGVVGPELLLKSAIKVALTDDKDLATLLRRAEKEITHDYIAQISKDPAVS